MDLYERISDFIDSLANYPPTDHAGGQIADIFNALLDEVKKARPNDPIVAVIKPATRSQGGKAIPDAGSLTAAARQLRAAVRDDED